MNPPLRDIEDLVKSISALTCRAVAEYTPIGETVLADHHPSKKSTHSRFHAPRGNAGFDARRRGLGPCRGRGASRTAFPRGEAVIFWASGLILSSDHDIIPRIQLDHAASGASRLAGTTS